MLAKLVKLAAKTGIVGGVIYFQLQQGVWGTVDEGNQAFVNLSKEVRESKGKVKPLVAHVSNDVKNLSRNLSRASHKISPMACEMSEKMSDNFYNVYSKVTDFASAFDKKGRETISEGVSKFSDVSSVAKDGFSEGVSKLSDVSNFAKERFEKGLFYTPVSRSK